MGLDITIKRIRPKHFDSTKSIEENFKNSSSKFVASFRDCWDWLDMFTLSEEEDENGKAYRFVTKNRSCIGKGSESKQLSRMIESFDFVKFMYIVEFDFLK